MKAISSVLRGLSLLLYAMALALFFIICFHGAPEQTTIEFVLFSILVFVPGWLIGRASAYFNRKSEAIRVSDLHRLG